MGVLPGAFTAIPPSIRRIGLDYWIDTTQFAEFLPDLIASQHDRRRAGAGKM